MSHRVVPVILCGGSGTRLWPLSSADKPKQLLRLISEHTMLQDTLLRLREQRVSIAPPVIVCNERHGALVAAQTRALGQTIGAVVLEPAGRNSAPAVTIAALLAREGVDDGDPLLLVLPADHVIAQPAAFAAAVHAAVAPASAGYLTTFGVVPTEAATGYGYIRRGVAVDGGFRLERFVEKPDADTAAAYLAGGDYYWNSGMFLFRADVYLDLLGRHAPAMVEATREAVERVTQDLDFLRLDAAAFARCPADSIDYAVMEKAASGVVVPLDAGWSDIGAWDALYEIGEEDVDGNRSHGDVLLHDTRGSLVRAESRLVAAVGLSEVLIVETADAVLVAGKGHGQAVKHVVARLREGSRSETEFHTLVHRPWGSYEGVAKGERYQVKRIAVKPGCSLSLQKHHHRAEHWVVVKGTARVTRGEEVLILSENESTYIPLGVVHRLENPGRIDLEIVEIQSGSYLGEDDIVRLEDSYGRRTEG